MILINGKQQSQLDFSDRGLQYGDGLFETIAIKQARPVFLDQHLQRLITGCQALQIPCPEVSVLKNEIDIVLAKQNTAVIKIIITRGSGGRGYQQPDNIQPTRIIARYDAPNYEDVFWKKGVKVRFCNSRLGHNPRLSGIKHLNRLEQVLARSEWRSSEYQEGLMLDIKDNVIEGTMSNLFVIKKNCLYTPSLKLCGIKGVVREIILQTATELQINTQETQLQKQQCYDADELFLTNSIIGLWPIRQLEQNQFEIGPITQQILRKFNEYQDLNLCR